MNGKAYIGQTISRERMFKRWNFHRRSGLLGKAIKKYGLENFTFEVLLDGIKDQRTLNLVERRLIHIHDTTIPDGYNINLGGKGGPSGDLNGARLHPEKMARGERNGNSKATAKQVRQIRAIRRKTDMFIRTIADLTGLSHSAVKQIALGRSWKHLL